jgi:hypothetical protein
MTVEFERALGQGFGDLLVTESLVCPLMCVIVTA